MVEQNEFSKAALRGLTKYLMSKEKEDMERKLTDKERAEQWLDKLIECNKQLLAVGDLYGEDKTEPLAEIIVSNKIPIINARAIARMIGVPVFTKEDRPLVEVTFIYKDVEFKDYESMREQISN